MGKVEEFLTDPELSSEIKWLFKQEPLYRVALEVKTPYGRDYVREIPAGNTLSEALNKAAEYTQDNMHLFNGQVMDVVHNGSKTYPNLSGRMAAGVSILTKDAEGLSDGGISSKFLTEWDDGTRAFSFFTATNPHIRGEVELDRPASPAVAKRVLAALKRRNRGHTLCGQFGDALIDPEGDAIARQSEERLKLLSEPSVPGLRLEDFRVK